MRNEIRYGTDSRGAAFLALPFAAYMGGLAEVVDLDEEED